jgi:hypothetical protein
MMQANLPGEKFLTVFQISILKGSNFMNILISNARIFFVLLSLCGSILLLAGCVTQKIPLFANATSFAPPLVGKTVAILPPFTVGSEITTEMDAAQSMDAVFYGDIAGVRFIKGALKSDYLQKHPDGFKTVYRSITIGLPTHFKQAEIADSVDQSAVSGSPASGKGTLKILLDSNMISGVERSATYHMTMNLSTSVAPLAPGQLDSQFLGSFAADYVLVFVPFGHYIQIAHTFALYGVIPFMGSGDMRSSPRGLFALYDVKTGEKVWEGQIGTLMTNIAVAPRKDWIPLMSHIIIGAAYLLTGDVETSLARILASSLRK